MPSRKPWWRRWSLRPRRARSLSASMRTPPSWAAMGPGRFMDVAASRSGEDDAAIAIEPVPASLCDRAFPTKGYRFVAMIQLRTACLYGAGPAGMVVQAVRSMVVVSAVDEDDTRPRSSAATATGEVRA